MDYTNKPFNEALAEILRKRHIKLRSLGAKTNLNYSYFSKIIISKKAPPMETIENIAQALGIEPEFFVEYRIHKICEILYNNPEIIDEVNDFIYNLQKIKTTKVAENKEDYSKK